jgi:hypothetical protein
MTGCIDLNLGGDYHSVTYYMNSGHVQTEEYRTGFFGPVEVDDGREGVRCSTYGAGDGAATRGAGVAV